MLCCTVHNTCGFQIISFLFPPQPLLFASLHPLTIHYPSLTSCHILLISKIHNILFIFTCLLYRDNILHRSLNLYQYLTGALYKRNTKKLQTIDLLYNIFMQNPHFVTKLIQPIYFKKKYRKSMIFIFRNNLLFQET